MKTKKTTINTYIQKITLIITTLSLAASFIPINANADASIQIGEYLQMGTYYGKPILWRCIDINENGPLMLSDKIICIKPFDANGINAKGSHARGFFYNNIKGYYRQKYGSDYWPDSNMRSWLNSAETTGNVEWLCENPPLKDTVSYNSYADESGFLSNFTDIEKNAVKETEQKSLLNAYEYSEGKTNKKKAGAHRYDSNISDVVKNYDTAYSEQVNDKIFLLDVKQVNDLYNKGQSGTGNISDDYYIGRLTDEAVEYSEYKSEDLLAGEKYHYWLRSPYASNAGGTNIRYVNIDGKVRNNIYAYNGHVGVRPAFFLNVTDVNFISGTGSESAPYTVDTFTDRPVSTPIPIPTSNPTSVPTQIPTAEPTESPTIIPTAKPTESPATKPTANPDDLEIPDIITAEKAMSNNYPIVKVNLKTSREGVLIAVQYNENGGILGISTITTIAGRTYYELGLLDDKSKTKIMYIDDFDKLMPLSVVKEI